MWLEFSFFADSAKIFLYLDDGAKNLEKKTSEYNVIVSKLLNTELNLTGVKNSLELLSKQLQVIFSTWGKADFKQYTHNELFFPVNYFP